MPKFVKSLIDRISGKSEGVDAPASKAIREALAPLDKIENDLGKRAATYVCTGEGSAVLLSLQAQASGLVKHLGLRGYVRYDRHSSWPLESILANEGFWDPELVLRLGQVYGAAEPALTNVRWGLCGTDAGPMWLRVLLSVTESAPHSNLTSGRKRRPFGQFTVERCRELLRLANAPDDGLVDILFHRGATGYSRGRCLDTLPGAEDYLRAEPKTVIAAAKVLDAPGRVELLRAIGRLGLTDAYLDYVFAQGTAPTKSAREAALAALHGAGREALLIKAMEVFDSGTGESRSHTASLIASALKEDARPVLEAQLEKEKGKRVRETIQAALTTLSLSSTEGAGAAGGSTAGEAAGPAAAQANGGYIALDGSTVDLPPRPAMPERTKIPDQLFERLRHTIGSYNDALDAYKKAHAKDKYTHARHQRPLTEDDLNNFRMILEGERDEPNYFNPKNCLREIDFKKNFLSFDSSGAKDFFAAREVTAWHIFGLYRRYLLPLFSIVHHDDGRYSSAALRSRLQDGLDFRNFAEMYAERGGEDPLQRYLSNNYMRDVESITFDDFWIYCAERLPLIDEALGLRPQSGDRPLVPMAALEVLERFPKVPQRYLMPLMDLATGSRKTLREPARTLLVGAPQIDDAIAALLKDGKQEARAGAADWLAARHAEGQVPALRAAVETERSDVARAAMLTALERLGEDISAYVDAQALLTEAEKGLKKANLKTLDWLALDALPRVRLRDGAALDPRVLSWWVVLANTLKQPGGNALFDLYLDRLLPEDGQRLGLFLLRSWVGHDTACPSEAEANAYAQANVDGRFKLMVRWTEGFTKERAFTQLKSEKLGEYLHSAIANKGLLGLASRASGPEAAEAVRSYLKNHGARTAQCKALLDCLAANPAPAATQVVLATANRFKAKTVQAHAQTLIEEIAERRGWTAEQLADRTIPTAGLDDTGVLELDCGEGRVYRASLAEDGKLVLASPAGKEVKALPSARNEEEQALVKAAKKALSGARKEIKQVHVMQAGRLFEAMCLEHIWSPQEWQQFLHRHPIVGRMCQRLVWLMVDGDGKVVGSFRPLEDGSLTDPQDEAVALEGLAGVKLGHQTLIGEAAKQAWLTHLEDYEVAPLFDQFSRPLLRPDEDHAEAEEVDDRRGHMIESFKLRGAAAKLGYQRGEAVDGGTFTEYVKRYDGSGIAVSIEFTGSPLPEENIACALLALKFYRIKKAARYWGSALPLGQVPPVLLSETWNDYHLIAAAGTGFDPKWEKKVDFW